MSRVNKITMKDLAEKYARPAKVIREAKSSEMQKRKTARENIELLHEQRQLNPDFYYDDLLGGAA